MSEQVKYLRTVAERLYKIPMYQESNTVEEAADFLEATLLKLDHSEKMLMERGVEVYERRAEIRELQSRLDTAQRAWNEFSRRAVPNGEDERWNELVIMLDSVLAVEKQRKTCGKIIRGHICLLDNEHSGPCMARGSEPYSLEPIDQ